MKNMMPILQTSDFTESPVGFEAADVSLDKLDAQVDIPVLTSCQSLVSNAPSPSPAHTTPHPLARSRTRVCACTCARVFSALFHGELQQLSPPCFHEPRTRPQGTRCRSIRERIGSNITWNSIRWQLFSCPRQCKCQVVPESEHSIVTPTATQHATYRSKTPTRNFIASS